MTSRVFPPMAADATIVVATLIAAAPDREMFAASLRRGLTPRFCSDSMELRSLVGADAVDAIVADLEMVRRASVWKAIRAIIEEHPAMSVVLWLSLTGPDMRSLMSVAAEATPDAVIIREIDDASSVIAATIRAVRDGNATQRVMRVIERIAPPPVRAILVFAARDAERPLTIHRVAASAGLSRRVLLDRLREAGLPSARDLINWIRLLHVAARLDVPRATVEQVAEAMGFGSSGAMCQLLARLVRLTPEQLRVAGGFRYLVGVVEPLLRAGATAGPDSPMANLGRLDRHRQRAWYASRESRSR